ncbi:MAG TPA: helix-turn-helix transcriptional regulator [Thermoanaerobaculia bacterium]|nr:helix-turn-helix transcriptional regulator [Thermoanaerobaculia bacterium]
MLHDEVRHARIAAGLTQSALARLAGIPRKQVRALESGANVTLATLRQIVAALPNLKRVTLGGLEIAVANADLEEARRAALDLFDVAKRLVAALGAAPASEEHPLRRDPPAGAVRYEPGAESEMETARKLEAIVEKLQQGRRDDS